MLKIKSSYTSNQIEKNNSIQSVLSSSDDISNKQYHCSFYDRFVVQPFNKFKFKLSFAQVELN